ncbi:hypothetical protein F5146DRAFT_1005538 [Armillaria mellea]|nr:hypothetical protein F5146DRAFT_1005538 [Armillaria mellea]
MWAMASQKCKAPDEDKDEEDEEDEEDDGGEDDENEEDEDYQETKPSSPKKAKKTTSRPKVKTSSGKAVKKMARSSTTSATKAPTKLPKATTTSTRKNPAKPSKAPAAACSKAPARRTTQNLQGKFSSAAPLVEATTKVSVPRGPIHKAPKTQASSIKDESVLVAKASPKPKTTSFTSINNPEGSHAPYQLTVRQKPHTAINTYHYDTKVPEPVKTEEVTALAQVITKPRYGYCQCSMSVQHQDCVFLGWGCQCNNCKASALSAQSQHKAKFIEATPENLWVSLQHAAAAQQVFKQSANATALATFEDSSFTAQLQLALDHMVAHSRILAAIYSPVANFICHPFLVVLGTMVVEAAAPSTGVSSGADSHWDSIVPETPGAISDEDQPLQSPNVGEDSEQVDQLAESPQKAASRSLYRGPKKVSKWGHHGSLNASTVSFKKTLGKDDIV